MALTSEHILNNREFFAVSIKPSDFNREDRKRGYKIYRFRRNGSTQYWKTRPNDFRVPIKYGLRDYGNITHESTMEFYPTERDAIEAAEKMVARMRELQLIP